MIKLYGYSKCSTCITAEKELKAHDFTVSAIDFVTNKLSLEELVTFYEMSGQTIDQIINKSGLKYKELNLKEKLPTMTENEVLALLANEPMLIKRPIYVDDQKVIFGFNKTRYTKFFKELNA